MISGKRPARSWSLAGALCLACAGHSNGVQRVVEGKVQDGPFISHIGYAAYAKAAQLEAMGDLSGAEASYEEALRFDSESPQIWTRLGSVRCVSAPDAAQSAFETAERLDAAFAPLWYERARCLLAQKAPEPALGAAERALGLDPEHVATSELIAEILFALERPRDAWRYLDALVARYPGISIDRRWQERRAKDLLESEKLPASGNTDPNTADHSSTRAKLDRALIAGDLSAARQHALGLELSLSELAARAVMLGRSRIGLEQARAVLAADPDDATALVVELVAADLLRDEDAFEAGLRSPPTDPDTPTPRASLLFAELLKRRVGPEAAHAWLGVLGKSGVDKASVDRLFEAHEVRLQQELGAATTAKRRAE